MITIAPITLENAMIFKQVRLRALEDAPFAFGSTYARESQFSDAEWTQRAIRWNGETGVGFVALDDGLACGLAGSFLDPQDATRAQLLAMWTAPTHRRCGVGVRLIGAIASWAHRHGATVLQLMVTSNNEAAIAFYERLGFARTGRTEPYPNDPSVVEYEMLRPVPFETFNSGTIQRV